ncbi:Transcriptional repressor scratch 1 [Frankliniella fusca]|uniref:Transcriptional repressor scratch 1 n=1 Tax=Frankliniella fusca TaxID=407009 RepID=A0AAE1GQK1_9NEOP|nr:Transcriptional repressor scratch 1 [Frankliniella fusca]
MSAPTEKATDPPVKPKLSINGKRLGRRPKSLAEDADGSGSALGELDLGGDMNIVMPEAPDPSRQREIFTYDALLDGRRQQATKFRVVGPLSFQAGAAGGWKRAASAEAVRLNKYPCSACGRRFASSSNLARHERVHRDEEQGVRRPCPICGKKYVSAAALGMHLLTHRPRHACGVCGKLFSRLWSARCHMRSHTNERPYGCAHCGLTFADRNNLRGHMRSHARERGVSSCPHCGKAFSLRAYLDKHLAAECPPPTETGRGRGGSSSPRESLSPSPSPSPTATWGSDRRAPPSDSED